MVDISVIIPALNEEKFLEKTLKSVLNQSIPRKDFEIIVSDGKSKDKTVEIAKKYADKIVSKKNISIADARNKGAEIAKGKYFVFVDSDTTIPKDLLKTVINKFEKKEVVGAFVNYKYTTKSIIIIFFNLLFNILGIILNLFIPKLLTVAGICLIARASTFKKIKGFNASYKTSEDIEMVQRLRKHGKFIHINKNVYSSDRRLKNMGIIEFLKYYIGDFLSHYFNKDYKGKYIHSEEL